MKLLFFSTVMVLTATNGPLHAWPDPTRGGSGVNLNGKMFTLSRYNGGLIFYSPYQPSPWATPTPDQPSPWATSTPDQPSPRATSTPDQPSPWATSTPDQPSPRATPTPDQPSPWATSTPDQPSPWATSTPDQPSPRATSTPDQPSPWATSTPDQPSPWATSTPDQPSPWATSTPDQPSPRATSTPDQPATWATPSPDPTSGYTSGYYSTSTPSYTETNTGNTETSASFTTTKPTTRHYTPSWTTGPPSRGFSVCLRYITDSQSGSIFTLSPSSSYIRLDFNGMSYTLTFNGYNNVYFIPNVRFWSGLRPTMWTSVCITVDNVKGVAQIFRDSSMSIRKLLNNYNMWSGEPVIDFSGFEGQVTDVQMWDYPLRYKEVLYYMSSGYYGPYTGSVLNWSYISYSLRGKTLLEDSYELQLRQLTHRRGHRLKGEENTRKLFRVEEESKGRKSFNF